MGGVDQLDVNIAILNNHTRNRAITGLITPTWIVFANTQRAALANAKASFKIRHTERAADRVQKAREQLGLTWKYITEFEVQAERLINETLTEAEFRKICDQIWTPPTNTATERTKTVAVTRAAVLSRLFVDADTNADIRGTRWAGYQTITEYLITPHRPRQGSRRTRPRQDGRRQGGQRRAAVDRRLGRGRQGTSVRAAVRLSVNSDP